MRGYQRSRARQPGHLNTARSVSVGLGIERQLYEDLPPGELRDQVLGRAAGSAAILHSVLAAVSRPGGASPRDVGVQLTSEQGRPTNDILAEGEPDIMRAAEEYLGMIAAAGAGAEIAADDLEAAYA